MRNVAIPGRGSIRGRGVTRRRIGAGAVTAALLLAGAAACSSSGSGSAASGSAPAASGTASASTVNVSDVTLQHRRSGRLRRAGAADRRRPDQQAAVQGALERLHLRSADAPGDGRRLGRHRRRRRRAAGVRRGRQQPDRRGQRAAGQPARLGAAGAAELADPHGRAAARQEHRGRAGQLGQLSPAGGPDQGRADASRTSRPTTCSPPRRRQRSRPGTSPPGTSGRRSSSRPRRSTTPGSLVNGAASARPTHSWSPPGPR